MIKISVLVISYNAERTIARCLESILRQSFADFELVIINDGSTDATLDTIKYYANADSRILVSSRENRGVATSRQEAIDMARGEYSIFVDSDDWVEPTFLETLYSKACESNSDIVMCDMIVEQSGKSEYMSEKPLALDSDVILGQMLRQLHGSLCNKLISMELYRRTGVRFLPDLNCCEDQYVVMALLHHNAKVSHVGKALYHYDKGINEASITNNWLDFPVDRRIRFIKSIEPFIITDYQRRCYYTYIAAVAYTATASPKSACPNYRKMFADYADQIMKADLPRYKKWIPYLRLKGIVIPTRMVKLLRKYTQRLKLR